MIATISAASMKAHNLVPSMMSSIDSHDYSVAESFFYN